MLQIGRRGFLSVGSKFLIPGLAMRASSASGIALSSALAESEGYKPADFDRLTNISGDSGSTVEIDENMLLDAMPDFIPFLPKE